jgi:4a-hydroxytetrahydrobiopterin dehydratase
MIGVMSDATGSRQVLDPVEIAERLQALNGWAIRDGMLAKTYGFADFVLAVDFVNRLAVVAEAQNHHPDLTVEWGKVTVRLISHDVGGLTTRDFRLAAALDAL